ncbi:MAG: DNA mismatch repair protein MutT [Bacteroides sp. SM23_62_1]|nr:MAG: DNA mismatch repair protein MutT [Bacteroides sp. SM23_62_1]
MIKYYTEHKKILVAIDCIIFGWDDGQLKLLILKRDFEPAMGEKSLIGGFVKEDESLDNAARRILYLLTGLSDIYLEQLYTYGEVLRDPGERVISVAYFALLKIQDLDPEHVRKHGAHWVHISKLPELIFDHNVMIQKAFKRLRRRAKNEPIGFELLPKKFTLPQLQGLYEEIYRKKFDNRNFRKKVLDMQILKKLDEKDKSSSKKGAYFYKFDKIKYDRLLREGFNFNL